MGPTIKDLRDRFEALRQEELARQMRQSESSEVEDGGEELQKEDIEEAAEAQQGNGRLAGLVGGHSEGSGTGQAL